MNGELQNMYNRRMSLVWENISWVVIWLQELGKPQQLYENFYFKSHKDWLEQNSQNGFETRIQKQGSLFKKLLKYLGKTQPGYFLKSP